MAFLRSLAYKSGFRNGNKPSDLSVIREDLSMRLSLNFVGQSDVRNEDAIK